MSLSELLPIVVQLPHHEKLCLLQFLANSLAQEDGLPPIAPGSEFPIWSPYNAFSAAEAMQSALQAGGNIE
jgi:hypothetical protein